MCLTLPSHLVVGKLNWKQIWQCVAGLFESYSASAGEGYGVTCPPCLLIHRPACTLHHWLSNARAEATIPAFSDKASCYCVPCLVQPLLLVWLAHKCIGYSTGNSECQCEVAAGIMGGCTSCLESQLVRASHIQNGTAWPEGAFKNPKISFGSSQSLQSAVKSASMVSRSICRLQFTVPVCSSQCSGV